MYLLHVKHVLWLPVLFMAWFSASLHRYYTRYPIDSVRPIYKKGRKWCKVSMPISHPLLKDNITYGSKPLRFNHWRRVQLELTVDVSRWRSFTPSCVHHRCFVEFERNKMVAVGDVVLLEHGKASWTTKLLPLWRHILFLCIFQLNSWD